MRVPCHGLTVATIIMALLIGCTSQKAGKTAAAANPADKIISHDQAAGELPCFRCHSFEKFSGRPEKGVFSHRLHITGAGAGLHCNQCHDFEGHKHISINKDVCDNCHNVKNILFNKSSMPARFDHTAHANRSRCSECHPKIFLMLAGSVHITMRDINNGLYCGACHNGRQAFSSDDCARCHNTAGGFDKDLVYKTDGMGPVTFSHKFHTSAFQCGQCHPKIFAMKKTEGRMTMEAMNKGKQCGACHNGKTATAVTECGLCHK